MTSIRRTIRQFALGLAAAAALTLCAAAPARAQTVALFVNGDPITTMDIEQRTKLNMMSNKKQTREEVIKELVDEKLKVKEARKFGLEASASDTDAAYASMGSRMRMSADQLTKVLAEKGVRPDTLKHRLKADLVWPQLVRGRYKQSLEVGEKDVQSEIEVTGKADSTSFEYRMRPILLVVPRGAAASVTEMRRKEADALRARIQSCAEAEELFRTMRDATMREMVVKTSADLPAPLRDLLDKTEIGKLTPPETTRQGVEMVALCGRNATTADTPQKREAREKLFAQRFEARSEQYLAEIRRAAMIEYR